MAENTPLPRPMGGPITSQLRSRQAPDYLAGLNPEQQEAVLATEGPLLVLAGAGTGKTRVLSTRIAHILREQLAGPDEILSVTFTNKAAREMRERIGGLVGQVVVGMRWLGTFHSICSRILRKHAQLVDLKSTFTILDTDDQIRLMKQIIEAEGIDEKRWQAKTLASIIDAWKNRSLQPNDVMNRGDDAFNGKGGHLYHLYQSRLKALNAADFGDLMMECIRLFRENPDVLAEYHQEFKYILVDEYQDSNTAQYLWLRLLAQGKPASQANICVVGDDDQSIYGWRGAEVDNILRFESDFPGAKVIKLERNYRSTANILKAASTIIAFNEGRLGKTLFTDIAEAGEPISFTQVYDSEEEARTIGDEIEQYQRQGESLNSMAILVRASFQMREFEERFITLGVNYRVVGGPRFYERKEIRDALAYLRLVAQPADDLAFERIVNVPKRGIGDSTVKLLMETARSMNVPLLSATRMLVETEDLKPKQRSTLRALVGQFDDWAWRGQTLQPYQLVEQILEESGYTDMLEADKSVESQGRKENLKELSRAMEEFDTLGGFLEHIALVMDRDSADASDAVTIMTLHSSKGLEYNTVFLPGWEDGTFPSQRSMDESGRAGLEEERRLGYVGITRGRKRVRISAAQNRRIHGLWQSAIPSRFIDELPPDAVEVVDKGSAYGGYGYGGGAASRFNKADPFESVYETPGWQRARANQASRKGGGPLTIEGDLVARSVDLGGESSGYKLGERVFHLKFGYGEVMQIEGNKLTIDFEKAGTKKVLESFIRKG
jgi:DNA helicase-2/ATP-dependent DNA helicase PcrA